MGDACAEKRGPYKLPAGILKTQLALALFLPEDSLDLTRAGCF